MTDPRFSLSILHQAKNPFRANALEAMMLRLGRVDYGADQCTSIRVFDEPAFGHWDYAQHDIHPKSWRWALETDGTTHHVFMTDDLAIAPFFWRILSAMVTAKPKAILGLLSNHPAGPELAKRGARWYRTNAWIVGPCYVVPRDELALFLPWYEQWLPTVDRSQYGDDSALNEWITYFGPHEAWHPLPTIIEHRSDIDSTWQKGDKFSRERVSWRATRSCVDTGRELVWTSTDHRVALEAMTVPEFWTSDGPKLQVSGASAEEAEAWRGDPVPAVVRDAMLYCDMCGAPKSAHRADCSHARPIESPLLPSDMFASPEARALRNYADGWDRVFGARP